jgi:hypothetical protein
MGHLHVLSPSRRKARCAALEVDELDELTAGSLRLVEGNKEEGG